MPAKTKEVQKKDFDGVNERDCFQTPKYATDLLIPYIPNSVSTIWECACGEGRIFHQLISKWGNRNRSVIGTDLKPYKERRGSFNFLTEDASFGLLPVPTLGFDGIVTNPPFSLKEEFFRRCLHYDVPFALLIPFDMNGWLCEAFDEWNCQGLVPNRRINYITPNTLKRIHEGEIWKAYLKDEFSEEFKNLATFKVKLPRVWEAALKVNASYHNYKSIDEAPQELLHKYSSSDFHSFWLTRYFNLPKQLVFVNLSKEEIKTNI